MPCAWVEKDEQDGKHSPRSSGSHRNDPVTLCVGDALKPVQAGGGLSQLQCSLRLAKCLSAMRGQRLAEQDVEAGSLWCCTEAQCLQDRRAERVGRLKWYGCAPKRGRLFSTGRAGRDRLCCVKRHEWVGKGKRWCHGVVGVDLSASKPPRRAEGTQGGGHPESESGGARRRVANTWRPAATALTARRCAIIAMYGVRSPPRWVPCPLPRDCFCRTVTLAPLPFGGRQLSCAPTLADVAS